MKITVLSYPSRTSSAHHKIKILLAERWVFMPESLEILFNGFLLIFVSEMGDKTQLLALVLATRFKKPWVILAAIFAATLANHGLSAFAGEWISGFFSPQTLSWLMALVFTLFAIWILIPDKEGEVLESWQFGAFLTTFVSFFLAEMGDKTQLATVALGAQYNSVVMVTLGTTLGMMASNALVIFFGHRILKRISMKWVRIFASLLFVIFALGILFAMLPTQ